MQGKRGQSGENLCAQTRGKGDRGKGKKINPSGGGKLESQAESRKPPPPGGERKGQGKKNKKKEEKGVWESPGRKGDH